MAVEDNLIMARKVDDERSLRVIAGQSKNSKSGKEADPIFAGAFTINSTPTDPSGLRFVPETHRLKLGSGTGLGGLGAGKNNARGADLMNRSLPDIMKVLEDNRRVVEEESHMIIVYFSTAGGTGSGGGPLLISALQNTFSIPIYAVPLLPFASECEDRATMDNTSTCLERLLLDMKEGSGATALIMVDNEHFLQKSKDSKVNHRAINREIAYFWQDLLAASEERRPRYVSDSTIDPADIRETIQGICSFAWAEEILPKQSKINRMLNGKHGIGDEERVDDRRKLLLRASRNFSIAAEADRRQGEPYFKARRALCLHSGPASESTSGINGMIDAFFKDYVEDAQLRRGLYIGGDQEAASFRIMLADIFQGAVWDRLDRILEAGAVAQKREDEVTEEAGRSLDDLLEKRSGNLNRHL